MDEIAISKRLSLILRHRPEAFGVTLDTAGWTDVTELLRVLGDHGHPLVREELEQVVAASDKRRFAFSPDGTRIRANQGHSVEVDLGLEARRPPRRLYHGTPERSWVSIRQTGLHKARRHHVHLHADPEVARKVGGRRGTPVVLAIDAEAMSRAGHTFFLSANGIWLTDAVPPAFIELFRDGGRAP